MRKMIRVFAIMLFVSPSLMAQDTLNVGVHVTEPFVTKSGDSYGGVSINLFNKLIEDKNLVVKYTEYETTTELIEGIKSGSSDVGVGSVTITTDRYDDVNFTQPYYTSSISLAFDPDEAYGYLDLVKSIFTIELFYGLMTIFCIFFISGTLFKIIESRHNEEFQEKGFVHGIYLSFMLFSTCGFGDIITKTIAGKIYTIFFGMLCLLMSSFITGNITSSIMFDKLQSNVTITSLNNKKVGTLGDCTSSYFLDGHNVAYSVFNSVEEGLEAVKLGKLDVLVYDTPVLQYLIEKRNLSECVHLSSETYETQFYGFPYSKSMIGIGEKVNPLVIKHTNSSEWKNTLYQYNLEQ